MADADTPALFASALSVALRGTPVLQDITFEATHGAITAVIGPNGAGKSTLLRAAAGLLPYHGMLQLLGRPLAEYGTQERAQTVAYLPQRSALSAGLEVETIVRQGRFAHARFTDALRGAEDKGLGAVDEAMIATDTERLRRRRFTELSVGERRRVLLARGLATGAKVLLLDEPTDALDVRHVLEVEALLRRLADSGYAVVVVLHALSEVRRIADHCLLLVEGGVFRAGPTQDVITADVVREAYQVTLKEGGGLSYALPDGRDGL